MQADSLWLYSNNPEMFNLPIVTYESCKKIFGNAAYASLYVPNFETGQIGVVIATSNLVSETNYNFGVWKVPNAYTQKVGHK